MTGETAHMEALLRQALAPVDPPEGFADRLETTLANLTALAAEELESWALSAMRDPRNWARPAAAVVVGTTAGAALVLLRARRRRRSREKGVRGLAQRTARDAAAHARRILAQR